MSQLEDLEAVVRGCNNGFSTTTMDNNPQTCFSPMIIQQDDFVLSSFPDFFDTTTTATTTTTTSTTTIFDELEDLYKPFYPMLNPLSPQTVFPGGEREPERVQEKESFSASPTANSGSSPLEIKHKRRKTQHKRVVVEVKAEGLSSDMWAWRKYGQKPIKGSPYPRSYYRCSSLKGCLARKQVERSQTDPEMFVITYTAEHCHSQPTRRSSLAGTTRHKFSPYKTSTSGDASKTSKYSTSDSPISTSSLAPKDMFSERETKREEENGVVVPDMVFSDDFFDELDRLSSDLASNDDFCEQMPMSFSC